MDTRIKGNTEFICSNCSKAYFFDAESLEFYKDPNTEAALLEIVKYFSKFTIHCKGCQQILAVNFDVWEKPAGIANYIAHSDVGITALSYEFDIDYYHHSDDDNNSFDGIEPYDETDSYDEDDLQDTF